MRIRLSEAGPELSRIVQGYWRLVDWGMSDRQLLGFIQEGIDQGITTVDHADIYGGYRCEEAFGRALKLDATLRDRLEIVTKCGICLKNAARPAHRLNHYDTSKDHIIRSLENSLVQLGTDRVELLLIHRPDPLMQADEVAAAFDALMDAGKVEHFGVSNFTKEQFELLDSRVRVPLATNQIEISPLHMDCLHDGTLDQLQRLDRLPMAWSCLGGGRLFASGDARAERLRAELQVIAEEIGATDIDQVVYAWLLALPSGALPILGSGNIERVRLAARAVSLDINRQQWFRIWQASMGHGVP